MPHTTKLDPLYETAKQLILDTCEPTISLLQRHLKIGYSHAQSLMAALEGDIVTALDDLGHRKMLTGVTFDMSIDPYCEGDIDWMWDEDALPTEQACISVSCFSKRGLGKPLNEDAVLLPGRVHLGTPRVHGRLDLSQPRYFAIADGVSSGAAPRKASFRLLRLFNSMLDEVQENASTIELLHRLQKEFATLGNEPEYFGMASTLVGARLVGHTATIFNVGDSRAYLLTDGANGCQAKLLSRDHNVLNDMLDDGYITPEQAKNAASIYRGLTSQFTADPAYDELKVNVVTHTLQQGERLLLCSDGLNEVLSDAEIAELFAENSGKALTKAYMASRRAGGRDDFSVIVIEVAGLMPI